MAFGDGLVIGILVGTLLVLITCRADASRKVIRMADSNLNCNWPLSGAHFDDAAHDQNLCNCGHTGKVIYATPAQSDAPSAEPMSATRFYWDVYKEATLPDGRTTRKDAIEFAEAYAALRTAKWENLAKDLGWAADPEFFRTNIAAFRDQIAVYMECEAKVAQLERELKQLRDAPMNFMAEGGPVVMSSDFQVMKLRAETAESALSEARERERFRNALKW